MARSGPSRSEALAILGLGTNATLEEIDRAKRILAKKHHPDVNNGEDAMYKKITEAHFFLTADPSKVDADSPPPDPFADLDNWTVASDEGIKISKPGDGKDFEIKIKIDSKLALFGGQKAISYTIGGARKSFKIKIPMGTSNGKKIRVAGKGYPGTFGGKAGDLYILVEVEVDAFKNDGDSFAWGDQVENDFRDEKKVPVPGSDIKVVHNIDFPLAVRGGQITIKYSVNGQMTSKQIYLKPGKTSTYLLSFAGEGGKGTGGAKNGDLNVHIVVAKPVRGRDINAYATIKPSHALALMFSGKASVPIRDFDTGIYIKNFESLDRSHRDGVVYTFKGEGGKGEKGFEDGDLNLHVHFTEGAKGAKFLIPGVIALVIVIAIAVNSGPQSDTYFPDEVTYDQNYDNQDGSGSNTDSYTEDPGTSYDYNYDPGTSTEDSTADEGATGGIGETTDETGNEIQPGDGSTEDDGATGGIG
jgi:DnaJ-class molecular chaperone